MPTITPVSAGMTPPSQPAPTRTNVNTSSRERAIARIVGTVAPEQAMPPTEDQNIMDISTVAKEPPAEAVQPEETQMRQSDVNEPTEDTPPAPKEELVSKQYALLAKKEKALRAKQLQQEQALREKEEAFKAREAAFMAKERQYTEGYISKDQFRQQPLSVLADMGISYDDLTQQLLNPAPVNPQLESHIRKLEAKIQELEQGTKDTSAKFQEQQQAAYSAAVKQLEHDVTKVVKSDPNFETVREMGAEKEVVNLIEQTYNKDGIILSVEEATQMVEDYLIEEALRMSKISKINSRLNPRASDSVRVSDAQKIQASSEQQPKQTQTKTLTNAMGATKKLSGRERAMLAFEGHRKS